MIITSVLSEILYVSKMADDAPILVVADIAVKARTKNQQLGVTGLLIFDGLHFCQQLEGSEEDISRLMEKIARDPRHTDVQVLHRGQLDRRRFMRFSMGFTSVDDIEMLERLQQMKGLDAIDALLNILPDLDLDA